jgi:hypothetical protein
MSFDIIGDLHGHAKMLIALLEKLGYRHTNGTWRHSDRKAIFLGDYIDRGPDQVETVNVVRRMVDAGSAMAIIGNHELNAIAWHTSDPENPGDYLRPHFSDKYGEKNRMQHAAFLAEVESDPDLHREIVNWFQSLPLWLDLPELRVVHACWHPGFMTYLAPSLTDSNQLPRELMPEVSKEPDDEREKDTPSPSIFKATEMLTKGPETPLPAGHVFSDKDGHYRNRVRIRWWDSKATNYRNAAMLSDDEKHDLPETLIPEHMRIGYVDNKPLFFGHYWLTDAPLLLSSTVACLDYSVAKGGKLCSYRWEGEENLIGKNLIWVG